MSSELTPLLRKVHVADTTEKAPKRSLRQWKQLGKFVRAPLDSVVETVRQRRKKPTGQAASSRPPLASSSSYAKLDLEEEDRIPNFGLLKNGVDSFGRNRPVLSLFDVWDDSVLDSSEDWWLDIENPTVEIVSSITKRMGLNDSAAYEILASSQRVREGIEFMDAYGIVFLSLSPYLDEETDTVNQNSHEMVTIVLFPHAVVTLHEGSGPILRFLMVTTSRQAKSIQPERVIYSVLQESLHQLVPIARAVSDEIQSLYDLAIYLSVEDRDDTLLRISTFRNYIFLHLRRLESKHFILKMLGSRTSVQMQNSTQPYIREIHNHLDDVTSSMREAREMLNQLVNSFMAKIAIDQTMAAMSTNYSSQMFALIATVSVPVTAVGGLGGMNIWFPGTLEGNETLKPIGFAILLQIIIVTTLVVFFKLQKLI